LQRRQLGKKSVFEFYLRHEYSFAAAQLALAMLGMGATSHIRDFIDVFRQPRAFLVGALVQLVCAPLVAVLINRFFAPPRGLALGLILVAAVPGGTMSNVFTYLARGNVPLSISLTAVTTLGCLVITPAILRLLMSAHLPPEFRMPVAEVAFDIAFVLLLPLAAGMVVGTLMPKIRGPFSTWCVRGSLVVIGFIVVGSAGAGRIDASIFGWTGPALIVLFSFAIQQIANVAVLSTGLGRRDLVAIGIEVTVRNTNLALLIKASMFPAVAGVADPVADGVLFVALLYGGVALPVALPLLAIGRHRPIGSAGAGL
jgi:BASS family bile acid:Na+ symporter